MPAAGGRLQAQIDIILGPPNRDDVPPEERTFLADSAAHPPDWRDVGDVDYLYREGVILASPRDVDRVVGALDTVYRVEGDSPDDPVVDVTTSGVTSGVVALGIAPIDRETRRVPEILDELDVLLGPGVARPDTVVFVCPHACPATEPEEVPARTGEPYPRAAPGACGCGRGCTARDGRGGGVSVAVVDTGFLPRAAADHLWLAGVTGDPEEPLGASGAIRPYAGHGTYVAGGVRAMAPDAQVSVKGAFLLAGADYESQIVPKLIEALTTCPDVVVLGFAASTRKNFSMPTFDDLYDVHLRHLKGVVVLAPAGNDGATRRMWPAAYPWVVSVGALAADWRSRAAFSNHGAWVDVYAPGEGLVNAFAYGSYVCAEPPHAGKVRDFDGMARWSGTSFAAPLVAGLVAARMSVTGQNGQQAAASLLRIARRRGIPGVGAVLVPGGAPTCEPE